MEWLDRRLAKGGLAPRYASAVAVAVDVPVDRSYGRGNVFDTYDAIERYAARGDEELLDIVHAALHVIHNGPTTHRPPQPYVEVEEHLANGHSIWMATEYGLVRRADETALAAFELAASPSDTASAELREAWTNAYGRDGDPSDAWDHSIRAVEAVLPGIVVPAQAGAHLGHVLGELDNAARQWDVGLQFNMPKTPQQPPHDPVQALVGILRLIYPNPDRHPAGSHRAPTVEEARIVVQLATAVVQWARDGQIRKIL